MSGSRALETNIDINRPGGPIPFDWHPRTRIVYGNDSIDQLGSLAAGLDVRRVMVVSDPGIVAAGHTEHALQALGKVGLETALFDGAGENPTTAHVQAGVEFAHQFRPDLLIGLGGGSSLDCAKGINFIYSCGGEMRDYWGVDKATGPMLPLIGVPTTAGTGSELQSFALISDVETQTKMACGDRRASCVIAILDPKLTLTQPARVTALTGIDAISHALETWVTRPRNPVSMMCSLQAWKLVSSSFCQVVETPHDLEARGGMLLGAAWAGMAIENSMLGAAHALANPLTSRYGMAHGQAVGVMLPHVIRFNGEEFGDWYDQLNAAGVPGGSGRIPGVAGASGLAALVEEQLRVAGLETDLQACAVQREHIPELAEVAARQWTGQFNPRPVDADILAGLYENAF